MKKFLVLLLFILIGLFLVNGSLMAAHERIDISIAGTGVAMTEALGKPFLDNQNRTQIPLRLISEQLGHEVLWNAAAQTVIIKGKHGDIAVKIGSETVEIPGGIIIMDTSAQIIEERTFVPLRFICQGLGYDIDYSFDTYHKVNILAEASTTDKDFFALIHLRDTSKYLKETRSQVSTYRSGTEVDGRLHLLIENDNANYTGSYFLISVTKRGSSESKYYYPELIDNRAELDIFFGDGLGEYEVQVLVNKEASSYWLIQQISMTNTRNLNKYLIPEFYIESNHPVIIQLAKDITQAKNTDMEKGKALYDWVSKNISYDYHNYKVIKSGDFTSVREINRGALKTLQDRKGVCCDYTFLFAALARSIGLQANILTDTTMVNGKEEYHAWNEFYSQEQARWVAIDATRKATRGKEYFDMARAVED